MGTKIKRQAARRKRKSMGIRGRIRRTSGRLRLSVFRSGKNIYCQIIDDEQGRTVAAASSVDKALRGNLGAPIEPHQKAYVEWHIHRFAPLVGLMFRRSGSFSRLFLGSFPHYGQWTLAAYT